MAAYAIAELMEITDTDRFAAYGKATFETLTKHGGKIIARSPGEAIEGDWAPDRIVMLQFDDMDALKNWYYSPEYQELVKERQAVSSGRMIFVDGV